MIFVTVGMHYLGFDRLVIKMDEIASKISEPVIIQIGFTKYRPINAEYFTFIEEDEKIDELIYQSRIIISHAGAGTILKAFQFNKPIIIVPRMKKYYEHIDDQQIELADVLARKNNLPVIYDINQLENLLENYTNSILKKNNSNLIKFIKNKLREYNAAL